MAERINASTSCLRLCFLVSLMQMYILMCAVIMQRLESEMTELNRGKIPEILEKIKAGQLANITDNIIQKLRKEFDNEQEAKIRHRFNGIDNAYLFAMTSFTTLGNSGLRPTRWNSKLFYVFVTPIGFALYVIIIVSLAYSLRDLMIFFITRIEGKRDYKIQFFSTKILATSVASCILVVQLGGAVSLIKKQSYTNGLYVSIDTMTFVGNEKFTDGSIKLYFSFLLSLYFIIVHGLILVFVCNLQQSWDEICDFITNTKRRPTCLEREISFHENYKEKLMASFESPESFTPPNKNELDKGDVSFPQMWSMPLTYDFEPEMLNERLMTCQSERRDSRFSEIFNAQRDLFEPIMEGAEAMEDAENLEEDRSDTSSYKSTKEFFEDVKQRRDLDERTGDQNEFNKELSSGECTPTGSNDSLPSSFSNISLSEWNEH